MNDDIPPLVRQDRGDLTEAERATHLRAHFHDAYGIQPDFIARAPGRVNLIGEHTDYNGGFVLPVAIDRTVLVATRAVSTSRTVDLLSVNYDSHTSFSIDHITPTTDDSLTWSNYVRAVAWALGERSLLDLSQLPGAQMVIEGNVPEGSGLSSSAAIEVATALAFMRLAGIDVPNSPVNAKNRDPKTRVQHRAALALACQYAENNFIGVKSGIMDQFISALGRPDAALLIDTRSLEFRSVHLGLEELGYRIVAVDSAVPRTLAATAYNQRRAECEQAVQLLTPPLNLGENAQLRDITLDQLQAHASILPEVIYRRARHVITENARTLEAVALMESGLDNPANLQRFGDLLYASHASLRDDYEVTSPQLDLLIDLARQAPGVAGARMTGAGFGGCTVNIVATQNLPDFQQQVVAQYRQQTSLPARLYICTAVAGGSYLD
ncbi:MAG TPA: galactokinase [Chloroflexia bacterium]|nr:galactokinase [Chloroflexia bacterium]